MKLFRRKQRTDAEMIEDTRKTLRISKWMSLLQIAPAGMILFWLLPKFIRLTMDFMRDLPSHEQHKGWAGFAFGAIMGMMVMIFVAQAVFMTMQALENLFGRRKDKLLIECYDALMLLSRKQINGEQPPSPYSSPVAGSESGEA